MKAKRNPHYLPDAAVDAARFYYSPSMGSYNKHLTCKAYKAAQALAQTLAGLAA